MNKPSQVLSLLLILVFSSCKENNKGTVVGWKTITHFEESSATIDTIGKAPYNFETLPLIITVDSVLRTNEVKLQSNRQRLLINGYEITIGKFSTFKSKAENTEYSRINIYHNDWLWNQQFIFSKTSGIVALFPSHSLKYYILGFKIVGNDTIFKLDKQLLLYFLNDTVLNPISPIPEKLPEVIEVSEEIEVLME